MKGGPWPPFLTLGYRAMSDSKTAKIAELNDLLRTTFLTGVVRLTSGIVGLTDAAQEEVFTAVRNFTAFTPDNDPYGEHDCAVLHASGDRIIFKIDYYDPTFTFHSEDPADPKRTRRVLTIMLAAEY